MKPHNKYIGLSLGLLLFSSLLVGCSLDGDGEAERPRPAMEQEYLLDGKNDQNQNQNYITPYSGEKLRLPEATQDDQKEYVLTLNTDCGAADACDDWDACTQTFGCTIRATVSFQGKTQTFDITPRSGAEGHRKLHFTTDNPKDPLHVLIESKVLFPPYVTVFNKTVPIDFCAAPFLEYDLKFHYVEGLIPKMYYEHNDLGCLGK